MKKLTSLLVAGVAICLCHAVAADETVQDTTLRLKSFNQDIHGIGVAGTIKSCDMLIALHAPSYHGDTFYGGYCMLVQGNGKKMLIKICDDDMVGHFTLYYDYPTGVIVKIRIRIRSFRLSSKIAKGLMIGSAASSGNSGIPDGTGDAQDLLILLPGTDATAAATTKRSIGSKAVANHGWENQKPHGGTAAFKRPFFY